MDNLHKPKKKLALSFADSIKGLRIFEHERNLLIQTVAGIVMLILMFVFPLLKTERIIILLLIGTVVSVEMFNTIIEKIIDHLHPHYHENIGLIKDAMAAIVLIVVIVSAIIGIWIFWPYVLQ